MTNDFLAGKLLQQLNEQGKTLATAESCTGGGIGHVITSVSGSSSVYLGGVVSYANSVKHRLLGVPTVVLDTFGAVSEQTARAMAEGVRTVIGADIGIGVTGIAGPNSDHTSKPVGLVYVSASDGEKTLVKENRFSGDREAVREQSVEAALKLAMEL